MIPLRDTIPSRRTALVTFAVIAANVAVFAYELGLGARREVFLAAHGMVPRDFALATLVTSMFLHAGWFHLLTNMLFLYIFGDNVEDRMGHARYAAFYLLCGAAAGAVQATTSPASGVPMVGASGAIAGVTGAYLRFYPRARIVTLVPVFVFLHVIEIPAAVYLLFWFGMQLLAAVETLGRDGSLGGVAVWAHVGGFVAGLVLGPALVRQAPSPGLTGRGGWLT